LELVSNQPVRGGEAYPEYIDLLLLTMFGQIRQLYLSGYTYYVMIQLSYQNRVVRKWGEESK
jgi:hypothetical protein